MAGQAFLPAEPSYWPSIKIFDSSLFISYFATQFYVFKYTICSNLIFHTSRFLHIKHLDSPHLLILYGSLFVCYVILFFEITDYDTSTHWQFDCLESPGRLIPGCIFEKEG